MWSFTYWAFNVKSANFMIRNQDSIFMPSFKQP